MTSESTETNTTAAVAEQGATVAPENASAKKTASSKKGSPKGQKSAKGGAQAAKGAPAKAKANKKTTPAKNAPRAKKVAKTPESEGKVAYGINARYLWPTSNKTKTLDLVVGKPIETPILLGGTITKAEEFADVYISCEAKAVMTEHKKSQPRIFDELSSSHEIVHQGRQDAIAAGITVVNIAATFASPLRNQRVDVPLFITQHRQPAVAESMRRHLLGLPIREQAGQVGFDAYCTVMVNCDNQTGCTLHVDPPAPRPGDSDHYETFLTRIATFYAQRFGEL